MNEWHGFPLRQTVIEGWEAVVVAPHRARPGKPWVWKTEFLDAFPEAEKELLRRGYHLAHVRATDLFGSPCAVRLGNRLYEFATRDMVLGSRVGLIGLSRGALWAYNWAAQNPEKTAAIYADNPVCDFKTWPARVNAECWAKCLAAYGFTAEQALTFGGNPVDNLSPLAAAGIPLLHCVGDADDVVTVAENSDRVRDRFRAMGGTFEEIVRPGAGHHPHGLDDPGPIADFFERYL